MEGGRLSAALEVLLAAVWPGLAASKATEVEAMSSSLEVAASSLRMTVVSTLGLDSSTRMGWRAGM